MKLWVMEARANSSTEFLEETSARLLTVLKLVLFFGLIILTFLAFEMVFLSESSGVGEIFGMNLLTVAYVMIRAELGGACFSFYDFFAFDIFESRDSYCLDSSRSFLAFGLTDSGVL